MHWTEVHVRHWIQWAVKEFGLANVNISNFAMDGRHLCGLTHPEFVRYIPHDPGDIFWTHLELLRKCKFVGEWLLCFTGLLRQNRPCVGKWWPSVSGLLNTFCAAERFPHVLQVCLC